MKKEINIKKIIFAVLTAVCIGVLAVSVICALCVYLPQKREQNKFNTLRQTVESAQSPVSAFESLHNLNSDYAGWLRIDGTDIDYPVMKAPESDPEYYLRRNFYKKNSLAGSLFLGQKCDTQSVSFIIYGHNMLTDSMFGTLDKYKDYSFAAKHRDIVLSTAEGDRVFCVFAAFYTQLEESNFKYYEAVGDLSKVNYVQTVENLLSSSDITLNDAPEYPASLMLLSTCSYHTKDGRFVVAAYEKK